MTVVALAGRRIDDVGSDQRRFPLSKVALVRERTYELFRSLSPCSIVCSAACGADLVALDVARSLGVKRRIILPFNPAKFRSTSVVDRPGNWGALFDSLCKQAIIDDDLKVLPAVDDDNEAYSMVSEYIIQEALKIANLGTQTESLAAVTVWEGHSRGAGDETAQFAELAEKEDFRVFNVNTL